jgi:hypothetical protein
MPTFGDEMKARYQTTCKLCAIRIQPQDDIAPLLRGWVHIACKSQEIAQRTERHAVLKGVTVVPTEYAPVTQFVGTNERIRHRRANRGRK